MKTEPVIIERLFDASPSRVWEAISTREGISQWFVEFSEFQPEVGHKFTFKGGKDGRTYLHLCEVTEVVPGKKLQYSWRYDGYEGMSWVSFELFAEGEKTRLVLTHEGLESFADSHPDFAPENFRMGWNQFIGTELPAYLSPAKD